MAKRKQKPKPQIKAPKVRIASPEGRPLQLRYFCPKSKREVRISTGSYERSVAENHKRLVESQLILGISPRQGPLPVGLDMSWGEFREQYRSLQLPTLRQKTLIDAESRLDIAERIIGPKTLGDMATADALHRLQSALLAGKESRFERARSPFTVKSYMAAVLAALNWAQLQGWIPVVPRIRKVKVAKLRAMKGRPLTDEEFKSMLAMVPKVAGEEQAESWRHVLRGLWESGLRLGELMSVSWDDENQIRPKWEAGKLPVLRIPANLQKNNTEEEIPLLPGFEALLQATSPSARHGAVFNPKPVNTESVQLPLTVEHVGKVISKIGKKAGIVVHPGDPAKHRLPKYASAHDLRRSCAQRMQRLGVPAHVIAKILRHSSWETTQRHYVAGEIQNDAEILRRAMSVTSGQDLASQSPEGQEKPDGKEL